MAKFLQLKVKEGKAPMTKYEYKNQISLGDPSLLLLIFEDLEQMFGAPIRKACIMYLGKNVQEEKPFPI